MTLLKNKLVLIIVAVLLLGSGGAYYFLFMGKKDAAEAKKKGHHKQAEDGEAHASEGHDHEDEEAHEAKKNSDDENEEDEDEEEEASGEGHGGEPGESKGPEMAPFIANLADTGSRRYVRLNVKLELRKPAESEPLLVERMPQVRDSILFLLSSKTSEQLLSPEGKTTLRTEMITMLNKVLKKKKLKKAVRHIYFTEFLIQ